MTGVVFTNLKCRLRACLWGLVSVDDVFGYMQCLIDLGYLKPADCWFIVECLGSKDSADREWIFQ